MLGLVINRNTLLSNNCVLDISVQDVEVNHHLVIHG